MTLQSLILQQLQDPDNCKIINEGQKYFDVEYIDKTILLVSDIPFYEVYETDKFVFIRHCINLLPYFDVKNPKYIKMFNRIVSDTSQAGYKQGRLWDMPETIRQALLTCGAMDLEELEAYALDNHLLDNIK